MGRSVNIVLNSEYFLFSENKKIIPMNMNHAIKQNLCNHFVQYFLFCGNNTLKLPTGMSVPCSGTTHAVFHAHVSNLLRVEPLHCCPLYPTICLNILCKSTTPFLKVQYYFF